MALELDPAQNIGDAWINTAVPQRVSQAKQQEFVSTGYDHYYTDAGQFDEESLVEDIKVFAVSAFNKMPERAVQDDPLHTDPRRLTTVATLAAFVVDRHPRYDELTDGFAAPDKQLFEDIKALWQRHVHLQLGQFLENGETSVIRTIAESIYGRRRRDPLGPPEGRAVTGIKSVEVYDEPAVEIPFEHWNRQLIVRNEQGEIRTYLDDGYAYVPLSDLRSNLLETTDDAFETHYRAHLAVLDDDQCQSLLREMKPIHERIDKLLMTQDADRLYKRDDEVPAILQVTMNAIKASDAPNARFHEPLSAEELLQFLKDHTPHPAYEDAIDAQGALTPGKLSKKLTHYEESRFLEVDRSGQNYKFKLGSPKRKGKRIIVNDPEDIFELPCVANMDEYLQEEKPHRQVLYTFARLLMSLENDFSVEEIAEVFSRWPWYDRQTTLYQLNYEKKHGEDYNPINCDNDENEFMAFCIGPDNCQYHIYSSLPLADDAVN